jgi:RAB6A-GEF complex partner protein 2
MGYAQISATFTVDGSLINQAVFEEVKRKGVVGDPGNNPQGMAVANNKPRKNGGLWGAFGLNAIEESLNGLLSGGELNGLRDMRGVASSKSIPLLSTPQSLLFVDLRLSPGEEKSFLFSFSLPRGLPASHKGKAIKFSYNLVIGTQRPSGPKEIQQVNRINVPFRVFSSVNGMY